MKKPNDAYYDLKNAARVSSQLLRPNDSHVRSSREELPAAGLETKAFAPVRFNTLVQELDEETLAEEASVPARTISASHPPASASFHTSLATGAFALDAVRSWGEFTEQALDLVSADIAFVVDGLGLVVAATGPNSQAYAESIGVRVIVALDQAREIDPEGEQVVSLELSQGWVTGFREENEELSMILVLRSPSSLSLSQSRALASALTSFCRESV